MLLQCAISSLEDCFDPELIATINITDATNASRLSKIYDNTDSADKYKTTGYIDSKMSGRPDGLYGDEINERDVQDLRMSAIKRTPDELQQEFLNKALVGDIRGHEGKAYLKPGVTMGILINNRYAKADGSLVSELGYRD